MSNLSRAIALCLALVLAACSMPGTPAFSTAEVSTVEPVFATELPPDYTPPPTSPSPSQTPVPPIPGGLGPTELKYLVLDQYPDLFFCDPDFYPIQREDELVLARQRFAEIQANPEEFDTILKHSDLAGKSNFTDDEQLLIYQAHKKLAAIPFTLNGSAYQFQIQVAKTEGEGQLITGSIDNQGMITVQQKVSTFATCPICLAAGTRIDTPGGPVAVQDLRVGMLVWTVDSAGARTAAPIRRVSKTNVPPSHTVVHLLLDDARELWVSPGHPTTDGRRLGNLRENDRLDGARVHSIERVPYSGGATYDLLPAGDTGYYWANGILIASTLK